MKWNEENKLGDKIDSEGRREIFEIGYLGKVFGVTFEHSPKLVKLQFIVSDFPLNSLTLILQC